MSLTACLRKLGKNVSAEDRAAIQALAGEHRKAGKSNQDAAIAAVREHMSALGEQHAALKAAGPKPAEAAPAKDGAEKPAGSIEHAAAQAEALDPNMLVQLEGMDTPMKVGELLARIKEEAARDVADGKLLEIAAACDLRA